MKRTILILFALLGSLSFLTANPVFSTSEQQALDNLFVRRQQVSSLSSTEAISQLESYRILNLTAEKTAGFSEEAKLVLDAFVDLEMLAYKQSINYNDPTIKTTAYDQYLKLQGWLDAHPSETPNKWMYCAAAEAFNWYLAYLPMTQILTKGMLPKEYYEAALEQDPDMSYALCSLGQWLYFAPGIAGGGTKKAKSMLEKSVKTARTNPEKYITHLIYSQILFQTKDYTGAEKELAAAEAIQPDNTRARRFRQVNAKGFSWFEFSRDFEKNLPELGEPLVN